MMDLILLVKLKIATNARGHILRNMIKVQAPWTQNYKQETLVTLSKLWSCVTFVRAAEISNSPIHFFPDLLRYN